MGQARLQNSAGCWTARSFDLARGTRVLVQIFRPIRNFIPGTGDLEARIASKRGANRRLNYLPATLTPFLRRLFTDETRRKAISPFYFPSGKGGEEGERDPSAFASTNRSRGTAIRGKSFNRRGATDSVSIPLDSLPFVRTSSSWT